MTSFCGQVAFLVAFTILQPNLCVLCFFPGHGEPSEQFYDINSNRFFIDGDIIQKLGIDQAE